MRRRIHDEWSAMCGWWAGSWMFDRFDLQKWRLLGHGNIAKGLKEEAARLASRRTVHFGSVTNEASPARPPAHPVRSHGNFLRGAARRQPLGRRDIGRSLSEHKDDDKEALAQHRSIRGGMQACPWGGGARLRGELWRGALAHLQERGWHSAQGDTPALTYDAIGCSLHPLWQSRARISHDEPVHQRTSRYGLLHPLSLA